MHFGQFVLEYLVAGVIVIAAFVFTATTFVPTGTLAITELSSVGDLTKLPGALLLVIMVASAYPIGYLLLTLGYSVLDPLGRSAVYREFNDETGRRSARFVEHLADLERRAGRLEGGYGYRRPFERVYSLVRLKLMMEGPQQFFFFLNYWTRLSRAFVAFTMSFALSGFILLIGAFAASFVDAPRTAASTLALLASPGFALGLFSRSAYLRLLRSEMRAYNQAAGLLFANSPSVRGSKRALVFVYGSNLLSTRMTSRIRSSVFLCRARLDHHEVVFNKIGKDGSAKANLRTSIGSVGEGMLVSLETAALPALDLIEGGYERREVSVIVQSGDDRVQAHTYIARDPHVDNNLNPFDWYVRLVLAGAHEHRLSRGHRKRLARACDPFSVDRDRARYDDEVRALDVHDAWHGRAPLSLVRWFV